MSRRLHEVFEWGEDEPREKKGDVGQDVDNDFSKERGFGVKERYVEGRLDVHVHFSVRRQDGQPGYFCAAFHHEAPKKLHSCGDIGRLGVGTSRLRRYFEAAGERRRDMNNAVPLPLSQFVQLPEQRIPDIGSEFRELSDEIVRLQFLYDCARLRADALEAFSASVIEALGPGDFVSLPEDRELTRSCLCLRQWAGVRPRQGVDEVVETCTQILNHISDDGEKLLRGERLERSDYDRILRVVSVGFPSGGVSAGFAPLSDLAFQLVQVVLRPLEFEAMARLLGHADARWIYLHFFVGLGLVARFPHLPRETLTGLGGVWCSSGSQLADGCDEPFRLLGLA